MPRPSKNTDQKLINAGRALIPKTGCSAMNLRQVARLAKVNLGMFHYHFKSKDEFIRQVLRATYEDFFTQLTSASASGATAEEQLRRAIIHLGRFTRDNNELIIALIRDVLNGNREVIQFVKENMSRHIFLIISLIQANQKNHHVHEPPLSSIFPFLIATIGGPNLAVALVEKAGGRHILGEKVSQFRKRALSDEAIAKRADLALRAIGVTGPKKGESV